MGHGKPFKHLISWVGTGRVLHEEAELLTSWYQMKKQKTKPCWEHKANCESRMWPAVMAQSLPAGLGAPDASRARSN